MAFRFLVSYVNAKATVSYANVKTSVSIQKASAAPSFVQPTASTHTQLLQSLLAYSKLTSIVSHVNLSAVDILLDADSKNLYFTLQHNSPHRLIITFDDSTAFNLENSLFDILNPHELISIGSNKSFTDTIGFGEQVIKLLEFLRAFADAPTITESLFTDFTKAPLDFSNLTDELLLAPSLVKSDNFNFLDSQVLNLNIGPLDTPLLTEELAYAGSFGFVDLPSILETLVTSFAKPFSDSFSTLDSQFVNFDPQKIDTTTVSEVFARTITFQRAFSDAFTLDDVASFDDPLATTSGVNKNNIASMSDIQTFTFAKPLTDTATTSEQISLGPVKPVSDTFGFSDVSIYAATISKIETVSISEALFTSLGNSYTDSATISESVDVRLIQSINALNTAVLNANALN